jgi:hypothetical protein
MAMPCLLRRAICVEWYCGTDCNATDRIRVGYAWTAWPAAMAMVCGGVVLRGWRLEIEDWGREWRRGEGDSERPRHCVRADLVMVAVASAGGHRRRHPRPPDRGLCSNLLHPSFSFPFHYSADGDYCGPAVYCLLSPVVCAHPHPQSRRLPRAYRYLPIHSHPLAAVLIGC